MLAKSWAKKLRKLSTLLLFLFGTPNPPCSFGPKFCSIGRISSSFTKFIVYLGNFRKSFFFYKISFLFLVFEKFEHIYALH